MKTFFSALIVMALFSFAPLARAGNPADNCNTAICKCLKEGTCGQARGRTNCVVKISAPTFGGKVALDIRDENGKSRFPDGPRTKVVGPGTVSFGVGCSYLDSPTDLVYLCVEPREGDSGFVSIRFRPR